MTRPSGEFAVPMILELVMDPTFAVVAVQAVGIGLLASLPFAAAGVFFARDLLALMAADAWVLEHGHRYTQWMLGGNAAIMLLFVINAIFRGAGDTVTSTKINVVSFWLIQIPLSYHLAVSRGWEQSGVFVSETSVGLFTVWQFSRG